MAEETRISVTGDRPVPYEHDANADKARIRADIESTRREMSDTLSQIQERLNPERLKEQAKDTIHEATIGRVKKMARNAQDRSLEAGRGMVDVMRDNPLPLALIGIGAGWLLMNSRRRSHVDYHNDRLLTERTPIGYESGYPQDGGRAYYDSNTAYTGAGQENVVDRARERTSEAVHNVADRVSDAGASVREHVSDAGDSVRSAASNAAHRIGDVATGIGARVSDVAGSVAERSRHFASSAQGRVEETPWIGAAVALGLGVAAGLAIPSTDRENQLMGDKRDQLMNRAREAGREKMDAVRNVVSDVASDARETLMAAKDSVKQSVREHAREEGLVSPTSSTATDSSIDRAL